MEEKDVPKKVVENIFLFVGIILFIISVAVIVRSVWLLFEFDNFNFSKKNAFEMMRSIGSYFGGTVGPLLTMASLMFLAANYYHNSRNRVEEHNKHVEATKRENELRLVNEWYDNCIKRVEVLNKKDLHFLFESAQGNTVYKTSSEILNVVLANLDHVIVINPKFGFRNTPEGGSVVSALTSFVYYYKILYREIDNIPDVSIDLTEHINRLIGIVELILPQAFKSMSVLGYVFGDLGKSLDDETQSLYMKYARWDDIKGAVAKLPVEIEKEYISEKESLFKEKTKVK